MMMATKESLEHKSLMAILMIGLLALFVFVSALAYLCVLAVIETKTAPVDLGRHQETVHR